MAFINNPESNINNYIHTTPPLPPDKVKKKNTPSFPIKMKL